MNLRTYFFAFAAIAFGCVVAGSRAACASEQSFYGTWEYVEYVNSAKTPFGVYNISLTEASDGAISGYYCFVTQSGNRVDCDPDKSAKNITGKVTADPTRAIVHFSSFFGAKDGIAELTLAGTTLSWKVVSEPTGGFFYGPYKLKLTKSLQNVPRGERVVVVDRAYLYASPATILEANTYIIKGDRVKLLALSDDRKFWKVSYTGKNGKVLLRWINCTAIDFCP